MANPNPTGISEFEEKKWLISRIDLYHKTMIELFTNELQKFENYSDKVFSSARGYRNNILSGLGVILTVVLGINATYPIGQIMFFSILTTLGVIGLLVIIIFNIVNRVLVDLLSSVYAIFNDNVSKLENSQGYIITSVAHIYNAPLQYVDNYFTFTMLLTYSITVYDSKELRKIAKRYSKIPQAKSELLEIAKSLEINLDQIPTIWAKLDSTQPVSPQLLEFVNKTLADYKPTN